MIYLKRTIGGVIGCTQSLLPLHSVVAAARLTSHVAVEARACCELSQGNAFVLLQFVLCLQLILEINMDAYYVINHDRLAIYDIGSSNSHRTYF